MIQVKVLFLILMDLCKRTSSVAHPLPVSRVGNSNIQALDLIREKNFQMLTDSCLHGHFTNDDEAELLKIASRCLQYEPHESPTAKSVATSFAALQKQTEPDHVMTILLAKLGTGGSIDGQQRLVVKGRFAPKNFEGILWRYISDEDHPSS